MFIFTYTYLYNSPRSIKFETYSHKADCRYHVNALAPKACARDLHPLGDVHTEIRCHNNTMLM